MPALYGAERATLGLMTGLKARGLEVRSLVIGESRLGGEPAAMARAIQDAGLPMERLVVEGRFSLALIRSIRQRLAERPASLLHAIGYKAHLHGVLAARGRTKSLTTIHGWLFRPELKEQFYGWLDVQALRRDDAVICLTSYYEHWLRERGVPASRLHRIPTGLDERDLPVRTQISMPPEGPFTLALAGRFSSEKNHPMLVRALARLSAQGVDFRAILAGEGAGKQAIHKLVADHGLADRVSFPGYVDMTQLLPCIHALVLCSRIENLPLCILEAMAWGRPVVATRVGGVPDAVVDGRTGFLVPSDDDGALAERLGQLARVPELRAQLGGAGRQRVEQEFTLATCLNRHVELYQRLAAPASS